MANDATRAPAPPSPRLVPLRPLGGTEIVDGAIRVVWTRRAAVFAIAAPFAVLSAVARALAALGSTGSLGFGGVSLAVGLVLPVFIGIPATGLLAPLISSSVSGEPMTAGISARRGLRALVTLLALAVVVTVSEAIGLALLLVGGIWLWGVWAVAGPAAVLEDCGPGTALRRSFRLVRGTFARVWGIRALGWLVVYVITALASVPFEIIGLLVGGGSFSDGQLDQPVLFVLIVGIGHVLAALLAVPISAAVDVLLYSDLRMRREGMDIVMALPPDTTVPAPHADPVTW